MEIFKKIFNFLKHNYWIFLFLIVVISYGQILFMLPWQDDNAIFFKLAHIQEPAGFLGKGIMGEGAYKYTAFFYYPIYLVFGYEPVYYFALGFSTFFISVLVIYKIISKIIGEKYAKIASFLYASGYIASDGFIRLYNSVITNISVIFSSLIFYFYWSYYKHKKNLYYILAILSYLVVVEFARARTHYLIAPIIIFETLFFVSKKNIKHLYQSVVRLIPFAFIFYKYFVQDADSRSKGVFIFIKSLLTGDFSILYGYLSSLTNIFIPNWFTENFTYYLISSFLLVFLIYFLFKQSKKSYLILINFPLIVVWYFWSRKIFSIPSINPGSYQLSLVYLGGVILQILFTILFYIRKEIRNFYLLFLFWVFINLASYSAYSPLVIFDSINRYLAHSFLATVLLFTVFLKNFNKNNLSSKIVFILIVMYGLGNLVYGFIYQNHLIKSRTEPVKSFYRQLNLLLPDIKRGDILYFDVADDSRGNFADAFSVAQMPDETAIAWRYGVDRYDFYMAESYGDFVNKIRVNNILLDKIHTFYYSKNTGLLSTTNSFQIFSKGFSKKENGLVFETPYSCVIQPELEISLSAKPAINNDYLVNNNYLLINKSIAYARYKKDFYTRAKVFTTSDWRERVKSNLNDNNPETVWQADRTIWDKEKTYFGFDLGKVEILNKFIWINGFGNNTPILYSLEVSLDNNVWDKVAEIKNVERIDDKNPREIIFDPRKVRFIRMIITKTLNSDSAGIAESWVVPADFANDEITLLEKNLNSPQLKLLQQETSVDVFWKTNASADWKTDYLTKFNLRTDGLARSYKVLLPCKGTELNMIKFENFQFPVNLTIHSLKINYYPIQ